MHKLIPVFSIYEPIFACTSSFLSQTDRCSHREVMGNLRVFDFRAVLEERIKLVNRGITFFLFEKRMARESPKCLYNV
jgi:hypothetical protein